MNESVVETLSSAEQLSGQFAKSDDTLAKSALRIVQLEQRRRNYASLLAVLNLTSAVCHAETHAQMLLDVSDFAGALDVVDKTKQLLQSELCGIVALQPLDARLDALRRTIEHSMDASFTTVVLDLLLSALSSNESTTNNAVVVVMSLNDDQIDTLAPLLVGLCRRKLAVHSVQLLLQPLTIRLRLKT